MENIPDQYVNDPMAPYNYEPISSDELDEEQKIKENEKLDEEFQTIDITNAVQKNRIDYLEREEKYNQKQ